MGSIEIDWEKSALDQATSEANDPVTTSKLVNFSVFNELTEISLNSSNPASCYPVCPGAFNASIAFDGEHFVYVTGGARSRCVVNDAHKLNLLLEPPHWERLPPLNEPRVFHGIVATKGLVVVYGGRGSKGLPMCSGEFLRPGEDWWLMASNMLRPRACFSLVLHRSWIYAFGGMGHKLVPQASCEKFPLKTHHGWEVVRRMPSPKISATATAIKGVIYVIGGFPLDHTTVEKYIIASNKWLKIRPLKLKRQCFAACSDGDVIYVGGGDELPLETYDTSQGRSAAWEVQIGQLKGIRHNSLVWLKQ